VLAGAVLVIGVGGIAIGGRQALHAIVMFALLAATFTGVWLPIASRLWWGRSYDHFQDVNFDASMAELVLTPPLVVAIAATIALFHTRRVRRVHAGAFGALVLIGIVASIRLARVDVAIYSNFIHVVMVLVGVAVIGLALLAVSLGLDRWRARRALARPAITGRIADDAGEVARVEIASWLRGPRDVVAPFTVLTRDGAVHVPGGRLLASLAPETTQLADGDGLVALRGGDEVALTGFATDEQDGHPFRTSTAPVAGGRVYVTRTNDRSAPMKTIAYALWRPSLAYLVVVVALGLAGLIVAATYVERTPQRIYFWMNYPDVRA